ncbi:MAG: hypothetical protein OXU22_00600, partial [Gammaproteobacteria bacterium]|nr:hypothetical protein [Gammaproteobacteria bacterium]
SGGALTEDLQVAWTRSGDAEDADFTSASDSSPLTIPAGSTQGRIRLVLAEDADSPDTSTADGFTVTLDTPTSGNTDGGGDGVSLTGTTADQSASVTSISAAPTGGENTEAFYVTGGPLAEPAGAARNTQAGATYPQLFIHYFNSAGTNLSASTTVSISIVPAGGANNPIEHSSANGRDASPPATQGDIWRFRPGSHSDTPFVPPLQSMQTDQGFPTAAQLRGPTAVRNRDDNAVTFLASDNLADSIASCGSATSRSGCDENTHQVAAFVMDPNHDNLSEGVEHFWVYLSSDRGRVGPPLLVAVNDNADDALTVSIAPSSVADGTAFDEGSLARFTVSISGATATSDVVVDYAISGANIEAGDFSGIASLTGHSVTIPVGRTSAEIVLTLAEDEVVELAESFTVTISNPRTAGAVSVGSAATANLGIAADPAGEAAITLTPRPDRNDVGNVITVPMFRVQLHRAGDTGTAMTFGQNVRLAATFGGTACHGTLGSTCGDAVPDYTRVSGGGVTYGSNYVELPAGTSAINLPGRIRGDPFNEGDETITITVTAITALPAGGGGYAALGGIALPDGGLSTTFTIANDDALTVTLVPAANAGGVPEGGSTNLRIELRGGSPHGRNDMTIGWAVMPTTDASDNDADPADFTATAGGTGGLASRPSGSFTIQRLFRSNPHFNAVGNGLRTVDLHITDEDLPDGDENFDIVVTLTNAGSDDVSFAGPHADGRAHYSIDAGRDQQRAFTLSGPTVNGAAAATVNEDGAEAMRTVTYTVTYTAHAMVLGIDDMAGGSTRAGGAELTVTR